MALKKPKPTRPVPNPLHRYASYTYSWALWWLGAEDKRRLDDCATASAAMAFKLSEAGGSFVVAEDSGLYPNNRQPGTAGLNYHIQEVNFDTVIGATKQTRSSNMISGSMTIIEPYGITFIDTLIAASFDGTRFKNYTEQPYLLELKFRGYDDQGNEITDNNIDLLTKRFPIRMLGITVEMGKSGATYKVSFCPISAIAHLDRDYSTTPKNFSITAGTVDEFFNGPNGLSAQFFDFFNNEVSKGLRNYAEKITFYIDEDIKKSKIVNETKVPLTNANPKVNKIDLSKSTFAIPRGTAILDIINKVMAHSDYLINIQLGLEKANAQTDQTNIFNYFKTVSKVKHIGIDSGGNERPNVFDDITCAIPKSIDYKISQYSSWSGKHPAISLFADSLPYTGKTYNYLYTGQNTDVVDLKLTFDTTYFTSILAYTSAVAAENSTEDTDVSKLQNAGPSIQLNPSIFATLNPQMGQVLNATPLKYKTSVANPNTSGQMGLSARPAAQVANDVLNSIYSSSSGDMVAVQLGIVGDPTLLKQDEWLYVPDFGAEELSQEDFSAQYGHLLMDNAELIATVNINSPIDMDADITNEGLAFPQPAYAQSLFSGQYQIIKIVNKFEKGQFNQTLHMVRYMNHDLIAAFRQSQQNNNRLDPVSTGTKTDKELVQSNTSTNIMPDTSINQNTPDQPFKTSGIPPIGSDNYRDPFAVPPTTLIQNTGPTFVGR